MPTWMGLGFQDSGGPFMTHLSYLHDHVIMIMLLITVFIVYLMFFLYTSCYFYKYFSEGTVVEVVWSLIPSLFLIFLVLPSMQILYMMEDVKSPCYTFKVLAHQWYWTYVSPLFNNFSYSFSSGEVFSFYELDSMIDLDTFFPRLLGCTSSLNIPVMVTSRFLISSTDVIHSFALPSLAMKVDAVPGRINQIFAVPYRCGVFFGQCSEICGSNHSFMPIMVKVMSLSSYSSFSLSVLVNEVLDLSLFK